eukprot:UN01685
MDMGGPVKEICVGRMDESDGTNSKPLERLPLGTGQVGLIYVNPEGFMGQAIPEKSAAQIREIFGRMGMDDRETVALIGGGHAFGKAHGACPNGPGLAPNESPFNPWVGNCGKGKGKDTYTSGIEGQWTSNPLQWDNEYFQLLNDFGDEYELIRGSGDKHQWQHPKLDKKKKLMMMTSDLALIYDEKYDDIVDEFANDMDALNQEFADAWDKLTVRGGNWAENRKCIDGNQYQL